jgi:glycosyltransferase involved in cell wall biosynthesis
LYRLRRDRELDAMRRSDRIVTLSEGMRAEIVARGISPDKIAIVPNAVDVDAFVPVARDPQLAAALGIGDDEVVLGYISSLTHYEGVSYLLDAIARLAGSGHPVRGLIVGDGPERPALVTHAARLGLADRVLFTGRVPHDEVLRYYGMIDVFVVPRTADRVSQLVTPLKPLEAMATARAVVVSGVDALREMIVEGETGLVFQPEDADHLASVVAPLLADRTRREALGRAARAWVSTNRTWEQNGRRYLDLYQDLGITDR